MRVENHHAHADTRYKPIGLIDYLNLFKNSFSTFWFKYKSLNVHLPFEIQHPKNYPNIKNGIVFIRYGELLKRIFKINLYWENAPEEVYGQWTLKNGQTDWSLVPLDIDLCLDIGHISLGSKSTVEARNLIDSLLNSHGTQIKHLHIHVNNLVSDQHLYEPTVVNKKFSESWIKELKKNRTFIYEKGE